MLTRSTKKAKFNNKEEKTTDEAGLKCKKTSEKVLA
jgi:hypothetical protein